jgi:hypothetical protein
LDKKEEQKDLKSLQKRNTFKVADQVGFAIKGTVSLKKKSSVVRVVHVVEYLLSKLRS